MTRPTYYDEPMTRKNIMLPDHDLDWLDEQKRVTGKSHSELIREALDFYRRWRPMVDRLRDLS